MALTDLLGKDLWVAFYPNARVVSLEDTVPNQFKNLLKEILLTVQEKIEANKPCSRHHRRLLYRASRKWQKGDWHNIVDSYRRACLACHGAGQLLSLSQWYASYKS